MGEGKRLELLLVWARGLKLVSRGGQEVAVDVEVGDGAIKPSRLEVELRQLLMVRPRWTAEEGGSVEEG